MRMREGRYIVAALWLLMTVACAHGLAIKQQATTYLSAVETSLSEARTAELPLFTNKTITADQHVKFLDQLATSQQAVYTAAQALQQWDAGTPAPTTLTQLTAIITQLKNVAATLPQSSSVVAAVDKTLLNLQNVLKTLGGGQ